MKVVDITGTDFERADRGVALLPVGSLERHGDHLPLGTDGIIPEYIVEMASRELNCLALPPVWYGSCRAMKGFLGTFNINSDAFGKYVRGIMTEASRNGVKILCVINGHGGNSSALALAAADVCSLTDLTIILLDWWKDLGTDALKMFTSPGHAGEDETSAVLAICNEKVKMEFAKAREVSYPRFRIFSKTLDSKIYSSALTGDARNATKEKGDELLKAVVRDLVRVVNEAQSLIKYGPG